MSLRRIKAKTEVVLENRKCVYEKEVTFLTWDSVLT